MMKTNQNKTMLALAALHWLGNNVIVAGRCGGDGDGECLFDGHLARSVWEDGHEFEA